MTVIDSFHGEHRFLSNFYLKTIPYLGYEYPSTEHAYQAAKTLPTDMVVISKPGEPIKEIPWRDFMQFVNTPGAAKKIGRDRIVLRPDWEVIKVGVMTDVVALKFDVGSREAQMLLDTGDAELVEGNTWGDVFWGVCRGTGENNLGKILMARRDALKTMGAT